MQGNAAMFRRNMTALLWRRISSARCFAEYLCKDVFHVKHGWVCPNAIKLRALSLRASPQTGAAIRFL